MEVEKHDADKIPEVNQKLNDLNENERAKKKKVRLCGLLNIPHMLMKAEGEKKDLS